MNDVIDALVDKGEKAAKTAEKDGRQATLFKYVTKPFKIVLIIKGKKYIAKVRKDGTIRFKKNVFTSPSLAASEITNKPMNGWQWWKYERAPGDLVKLDELMR